jgi:hypothetical protein
MRPNEGDKVSVNHPDYPGVWEVKGQAGRRSLATNAPASGSSMPSLPCSSPRVAASYSARPRAADRLQRGVHCGLHSAVPTR